MKNSLSIVHTSLIFIFSLAFSEWETLVSRLKPEEKALSCWSLFFKIFLRIRPTKAARQICSEWQETRFLALNRESTIPRWSRCYHPINYGNQLMTWILWILSVFSAFIGIWFFILQIIWKKEKKKKKKKKRKIKRKKKRKEKEKRA